MQIFSSTYDSNLFPAISCLPTLYSLLSLILKDDFASNTFLDDLFCSFVLTAPDHPFLEETVANFAVADCTAVLE